MKIKRSFFVIFVAFKAMNLVYENRNTLEERPKTKSESVLRAWLMANSMPTIQKFAEMEKHNFKKSLTFSGANTID